MSSQQQRMLTEQTIPSISPIDPISIVEHGESPTAIILAIAILIAIVVSSITGLIRVLLMVMMQCSKPSR